MKSGFKWASLLSTVADRWDPRVRRPHTSAKQKQGTALHDAGAVGAHRRRVRRRWHLHIRTPTTSRTCWYNKKGRLTKLGTTAAAMVARRCGLTVLRQWWPRWPNQMHVWASTDHGEPSAQENTKNGGWKWRGHNDGLGGGAPVSSCAV